MKKTFSFALVVWVSLQPLFFLTVTPNNILAQTIQQEVLTNTNIVNLTKAALPAQAIIEKIRVTKNSFDLSAQALAELKALGIADAVIVAMLQTQKTANPEATLVSSDQKVVEIKIPDGTEIQVQLENNMSGQEQKEGEVIDMTVARDVVVNGQTVIAQGASATARISVAKKAGYWGKTGKLEWTMQDVQTVCGNRIAARFTKALAGGSNSGSVAVGAVVTTVLLGPVGLLWGLKKGKKAVIPAGSRFSVYSDKDSIVKFYASNQAATVALNPAQ